MSVNEICHVNAEVMHVCHVRTCAVFFLCRRQRAAVGGLPHVAQLCCAFFYFFRSGFARITKAYMDTSAR